MRKKIMTLFMAMTMALSFAACGDSKSEGENSGGETKTEVASNELTVWAWDKAFNIYAMEEAQKIYEKDHPDFKLNIVEMSWPDIETQLGTILSAGETEQLPDILLMQDFAYQKYVKTYDNLFQDITNSGIDFSQFAKGKLQNSTVENKNYGVPFDNGTVIAAYRIDILEKAGYTEKDLTDIDWNRFLEIGKDVKAKTGYSLFSTQANSSDTVLQMVQSAGGSIWKENGEPFIVGNDILKQSIEVYKSLFDAGVLELTNSWDEYIGTFTSGKTLGTINGCWIMASVQTSKDQAGLWRVTNMPSLPGVSGATNNSNQGGSSWGVTTNCKNTELATDFLKNTFAGSTELYDILLPNAGALGTWLPASESKVYGEPQEFYGGEPVFTKITDFASKTPAFEMGIYYTEANDAIKVVVANVCAGANIDDELKTAEETVLFNMGN